MPGLLFKNCSGEVGIECQRYLEKKERSFRKETVEYLITFKSLVERQQDEGVRVSYNIQVTRGKTTR